MLVVRLTQVKKKTNEMIAKICYYLLRYVKQKEYAFIND